MNFLAILLPAVVFASTTTHVPYANNRPMTANPSGSALVPKCEITVRFNEDEQSVPESDYLDSMFCLGLMEGILNTNAIVRARSPDQALFCIPDPGIKNWVAAKVVVEFAKARPDLLELDENVFAVAALAAKYPCKASNYPVK